MTTQTTTLADFVLARIAEDEAAARAAAEDDGLIRASQRANKAAQGRAADVAHIARHDPARVLADCEARRRIVELAEPETPDDLDRYSGDFGTGWTWAHADVLTALASVYADHPDFDETWLL